MEAERLAKERPTKIVPASNYKEKYEHLIGRAAAKDAAQSTVTNRVYGFGKYKIETYYDQYLRFQVVSTFPHKLINVDLISGN